MTECSRVPWTLETAWSICINEFWVGGVFGFYEILKGSVTTKRLGSPTLNGTWWHSLIPHRCSRSQRLRRTVTWLGRTPRAPRTPLDSYNLSSQVTDSICSIFKKPVRVALLFCLPAQPGKSLSLWLTTILPWTIVCELRHSLLLTHWTGKSWF